LFRRSFVWFHPRHLVGWAPSITKIAVWGSKPGADPGARPGVMLEWIFLALGFETGWPDIGNLSDSPSLTQAWPGDSSRGWGQQRPFSQAKTDWSHGLGHFFGKLVVRALRESGCFCSFWRLVGFHRGTFTVDHIADMAPWGRAPADRWEKRKNFWPRPRPCHKRIVRYGVGWGGGGAAGKSPANDYGLAGGDLAHRPAKFGRRRCPRFLPGPGPTRPKQGRISGLAAGPSKRRQRIFQECFLAAQ